MSAGLLGQTAADFPLAVFESNRDILIHVLGLRLPENFGGHLSAQVDHG